MSSSLSKVSCNRLRAGVHYSSRVIFLKIYQMMNYRFLLREESRIKYPRLLLLVLSFVVAYFLFADRSYVLLHNTLVFPGYFGTFMAGFLYAYAFTAAPATTILLMLAKEQNILFAGFIAGIGALLSDLIIFHFMRHGFSDEVQKLSEKRIVRYAQERMPDSIRKYLFASLSAFLIASPLSTEIGVTLMASKKSISAREFSIIVYSLHTGAIFVILLIGSTI